MNGFPDNPQEGYIFSNHIFIHGKWTKLNDIRGIESCINCGYPEVSQTDDISERTLTLLLSYKRRITFGLIADENMDMLNHCIKLLNADIENNK